VWVAELNSTGSGQRSLSASCGRSKEFSLSKRDGEYLLTEQLLDSQEKLHPLLYTE
jgi:hypothetical protein